MGAEIHSISYGIAIAVVTLLVVSFYAGQLAHVISINITTQIVDAARFITIPLALTAVVVLGILLSNSRQSFNEKELLLEKFAAQAIMLNREIFYDYGEKGREAHNALRYYVDHINQDKPLAILGNPNKSFSEPLVRAIAALPVNAKDPISLSHRDKVEQMQREMSLSRMELATKRRWSIRNESILLVTMWFCVVYACLGLTSPWGSKLLMGYGLLSAFCVASSIWLLCEWSQPLAGMITLSQHPIDALEQSLQNIEEDMR